MTIYDDLGGETGVRALVDRFYDLMHERPEAAVIRQMHGTSLDGSRDKLFWFLSGWLGGPQLFLEKRGHPRLRARHLPFAIDDAARDAWMLCMRTALGEHKVAGLGIDNETREKLDHALFQLADHMKNDTPRGLKLVE